MKFIKYENEYGTFFLNLDGDHVDYLKYNADTKVEMTEDETLVFLNTKYEENIFNKNKMVIKQEYDSITDDYSSFIEKYPDYIDEENNFIDVVFVKSEGLSNDDRLLNLNYIKSIYDFNNNNVMRDAAQFAIDYLTNS